MKCSQDLPGNKESLSNNFASDLLIVCLNANGIEEEIENLLREDFQF